MTTVHAALQIDDNQHITIFYSNRCDANMLCNVVLHLLSLPIGRIIKIVEYITLDNHKNKDEPLVGARLVIMDESGEKVDENLMFKISEFSDKNSWIQNLEEQYKYTMHVTLGLKSEVNLSDYDSKMYKIEKKYFKNHATNQKIYL